METKKRELTRITINVPAELLKEIDAYASKNTITRTTAIALICRTYFENYPNNK